MGVGLGFGNSAAIPRRAPSASAPQVTQKQGWEVAPPRTGGKMLFLCWRYCQGLDISASVFKQSFVSLKCSQCYYPKDSAIIISRCFASILTFFFLYNALQLFNISQIKHCFCPENNVSNLDHSSAEPVGFFLNSGEYLFPQIVSILIKQHFQTEYQLV